MPRRAVSFLILCLMVFALLPVQPAAAWQQRVDAWVLQQVESGGESDFLIYLTEQADLSGADQFTDKTARGRYVVEQLQAVAQRSQRQIIRQLQARGLEYRSYWIANAIWVRGNLDDIQVLAARPEVARLLANPAVRADLPEASIQNNAPQQTDQVNWGLNATYGVDAEALWARGFTGEGVVVAGQDTGYLWTHPELQPNYRGWDGATADHNFNWHDAISGDLNGDTNNPCGYNLTVPCDDHGHGTHTMGTMAADNVANTIAVAPDARWISCRNMEEGVGTPQTYMDCYQFFIAPTDLNGDNPDPAKAPDIINNSWGCPTSEGCTDPAVLLATVQAVHAAGILTVHSAGNGGLACGSVNTPAAIYAESLTVGNHTSTGVIAPNSSRGPVTVDGSNRWKPDVTAPGTSIFSTTLNNGYTTLNGTSMAAPHVAGLAALLIEAQPSLRGNPDAIRAILTQSSTPVYPTVACDVAGGETLTSVPNNTYGWGRVDGLQAFDLLFPEKHFLPVIGK